MPRTGHECWEAAKWSIAHIRVILLLLLLFSVPAIAATVTVGSNAKYIDLRDFLEYRGDPSGTLDIAAVAKDSPAFHTIGQKELNLGYSGGAHWLRVSVVNVSDVSLTRWLEVGHSRLQSVRLFWREASGAS